VACGVQVSSGQVHQALAHLHSPLGPRHFGVAEQLSRLDDLDGFQMTTASFDDVADNLWYAATLRSWLVPAIFSLKLHIIAEMPD
jgi:hypothetical protein